MTLAPNTQLTKEKGEGWQEKDGLPSVVGSSKPVQSRKRGFRNPCGRSPIWTRDQAMPFCEAGG